jgi:hypothetical protein
LEGGALAPSVARAWVSERLRKWEASGLSDTAALLTSEVVSNAVRHAQTDLAITAAMAGGFLEIGVVDGSTEGVPRVKSIDDPTALGGRGMAIVDALAAGWGTSVNPENKYVWFRLAVNDWPFLAHCLCDEDHAENVALGSGHKVRANPGAWDESPP